MFDGFVEELAKIQKAKIEGDKTDDTSNTKNEEDLLTYELKNYKSH